MPSEYEDYFIDPIGEDEAYFSEYKKTNLKTIAKSFSRMFYSFEAKNKLNKLIKDVNPDLIYVLQYQNKISVSIFDAAAKNKIPVIHRISDFGQICADNLFFRPTQKDICERCLTGSKFNAIYNKCVLDSYIYSSIKAASLKFQELMGISKKVHSFVVPSNFTIEKLRIHGFPEKNLKHIPSFFNWQSVTSNLPITYERFALYIGRISPEKGLTTLLKAFVNTEFKLKIIGFSNPIYEAELKEYLKDKPHHVEFLGKKDFNEIQTFLSQCLFTVAPSECYDNFPNTILESFAFKKCVVTTNIGSLKEIVTDLETGLLFRPHDSDDLQNKISRLFANVPLCRQLGENAYIKLNKEYSADNHYHKILKVFEDAIEDFQPAQNN